MKRRPVLKIVAEHTPVSTASQITAAILLRRVTISPESQVIECIAARLSRWKAIASTFPV